MKWDLDKHLIKLSKRRIELRRQKRNLPWVELEEPYQRGWKRFFVLRPDVKHSARAEFYEALLVKINTVEFHHDKSFKRKKRRKRKYGFEVRHQMLRELDQNLWYSPKLNLSEQEKACFTCVETYNVKSRRIEWRYVFTEPWRFVLKIAPNMITHTRQIDIDIERELAWIDAYIEKYDLEPRIDLLTRGRGYHWSGWYYEHPKHINELKNKPRHIIQNEYLEQKIEPTWAI